MAQTAGNVSRTAERLIADNLTVCEADRTAKIVRNLLVTAGRFFDEDDTDVFKRGSKGWLVQFSKISAVVDTPAN